MSFTLSKLYDVPVVTPLSFKAVCYYICGRRRVSGARYRMICLVIYFKRTGIFYRNYWNSWIDTYRRRFEKLVTFEHEMSKYV